MPEPDQSIVDEIVRITTSKCFDWAQGAIAETMAAIAAQLTVDAVVIRREISEQDCKDLHNA